MHADQCKVVEGCLVQCGLGLAHPDRMARMLINRDQNQGRIKLGRKQEACRLNSDPPKTRSTNPSPQKYLCTAEAWTIESTNAAAWSEMASAASLAWNRTNFLRRLLVKNARKMVSADLTQCGRLYGTAGHEVKIKMKIKLADE